MIVKDEVDVLARCLASCRDWIDYWVISDTGSTDGTQDLIRRELAAVRGELHEHEWVNFGHNRSLVMDLAHGKADYLLIIDADTTIEADPDVFVGLDADAYLLRHVDGTQYYTKRLVRGRLHWRYVGAVHEFITSDEERSEGRLEDVVIRSFSTGGARHGRWQRDAELLEAEYERDPENARTVFYLAQTYRDLGDERGDSELLTKARDLYEVRANMGAWVEESFGAWRAVGQLSDRIGEWPRAIDAFIRAWETRPERLESVHDLVVGLLERRHFRAANRFAKIASGSRPLPIPEDLLFVEPWIYEWGLLFQYTISSYWCGEYDASIRACNRLLAMEALPEDHRKQTVANLQFATREKGRELAEQAPAKVRTIPHVGTPTRGRARY